MKNRHRTAAQSPRSTLVVLVAIVLLVGSFIDAAAQSTASTPLAWGSNSAGQLGYANPVADLSPDLVFGLGPGSGVTAISAGGAHSLALKSDGTVLAWGSNGNGQLGDGTTTPRLTPVPVSGLGPGSGVVAIATGGAYSLALKSDGTVLAWGNNANGQLGDSTITQRTTPVTVSAPGGLGALNGVIAVAAGGGQSLALKSDSTVLAWGSNGNGQLGDGTITQRTTPVAVRAIGGVGTLSGVTMIAAGGAYSLALRSDGTVAAWGFNSFGQLGDGTTTQRTTPVQVSDLGPGSGVLTIAAGGGHSLALKADGTLLAWGANNGQLGDGTTTNRLTPVQVFGLGPGSGVVAIAAGNGHSLALKFDGTVLAWGVNPNGQLGDSTTTNRLTPVQVSGLGPGSGVVALAADATGFHSLALKSDGTVLAWGSNANGQLGDGSIDAKLEPYPLRGVLGAVAAVAGGSYSLALSVDGTVTAWGANNNGQLGDGTTTTRVTPLQVMDPSSPSGLLTGVIAIAGVNAHSLALKSDGTVMAWGFNGTGQLGDGTTTNRLTAVPVSGLGSGSDVVAIAAGGFHSLALKTDGTVLAWGNNGSGQLGDGTTTQRTTPVQVSGLGPGSGVVAVDASGSHSLALKSDGTILAWGGNANGQLGDGTTTNRLIPVQASGLGSGSGVVAIAAGGSHSLALKADGTLLAWGSNANGQLGDGSTTQRTTPVQVSGLGLGSGVVAIDAGGGYSLALHLNGKVQAWGNNTNGQLGDGTLTGRLTPVQVSGLGSGSGVVAIAAGSSHSLVTIGPNPIDRTDFFVRRQYIDLLGREPDPPGFTTWVNGLNNCPQGDTSCDRVHVSEQFFKSEEFRQRGLFVYLFYPVSYGRKPDYAEFIPDLARVSGFLSTAQLEAAKVAFIADFMARPAFVTKYSFPNTSAGNTSYVDTLLQTAAVTLPASTRQAMIDGLNNNSLTRAPVLRQIAESTEVSTKYFNQAFVVMEYFGYLRRDPDALYLNWIQVLDANPADSRHMVEGFVNSKEYRQRFGPT